MIDFERHYHLWKENVNCPDLKNELAAIENEKEAIQERFYKGLEFGTGGMRGLMGAGPNRINIYTVRKATQGLANYLHGADSPGKNSVVIAYDSRRKSRDFAREAALVLAKNGIKALVFEEITPTPLLSFAVRELKAAAGIVITASHNPKEYNGYKVYNRLGGQVTDELAEKITTEIEKIEDVFAIEIADQKEAEDKNLLVWLGDEILDKYLAETEKLILNKEMVKESAHELKVVYSPLHGTGLVPLTRLFEQCGFTGLNVVQQQAAADPEFPTVVYPNPEEEAACSLAICTAGELHADVILVTDPDADRIGLVVKNEEGRYQHLTGNQTGALLIDYLLQARRQQGTIPHNGVIVKTIVTSEMGAKIAAKYGVKHVDVLTGFKYIGEKIAEFEESGEYTFLFGYEESYGYLVGQHVRDKDAIQTALVIAEMALYHKKRGLNLYKRLQQLFAEFGYYREALININLAGREGQNQIALIMDTLRRKTPDFLAAYGVQAVRDYLTGKEKSLPSGKEKPLNLPVSNVLYYVLDEGSWCCVRPSGTEPKLKIYLATRGESAQAAQERLQGLAASFSSFIKHYTK
ncbi:MAG: phospho-sugar mutase [Peptococcaceae bacterium]|jgi:phosphoglucomutase|nr:phospho-sugar mutase [Peptococcaceae bacterium]MDH7524700.1 phospho-sugar mutase [Peptococcaceae bacterium]